MAGDGAARQAPACGWRGSLQRSCCCRWPSRPFWKNGEKQSEAVQQSPAAGTAANILAPLPMQGDTGASAADSAGGTAGEGSGADDAAAVTLEQFGPARQAAGAYQVKAYDSSVIRQPGCGQVDLSYFSDAALLGDSLTVGFSDYSINLGGALICGYTGVGPDAIVNRSAVKSSVRGSEVAMDVLTAAQPKKALYPAGHQHPDHAGGQQTAFWPTMARCWISSGRLCPAVSSMSSPSRRCGPGLLRKSPVLRPMSCAL